jgi:hypothetical protein
MTADGGTADIITRLSALTDNPGIAPGVRKQCGEIRKRLASPVRVTVAGLPDSGKSTFVNMLAGANVIPAGAGYPTCSIGWGDSPKTIVTYQDGSTTETVGIALGDFDPRELALVRVEAPLEILRKISLLELVTDGTREDLASALKWAMPRTDMALWCAQDLTPRDQAIWRRVPQSVKDHSYFILTKADLVAAAGVVADHIRRLQGPVSQDFRGLFPVAARQAVEAKGADGRVDEAAMRASGGARLIAELTRSVDRGKQEIVDAASLFLSRYAPETKPPAAANTAPAPAAPAPKPPAAVADAPCPDEAREICAVSFEYLRRRARDLAAEMGPEDTDAPAEVLGHCMETIEHLVDVFADAEGEVEGLDALRDVVNEASDIVMLLQLEEDAGPAADAVTLLLQLRRDFETCLAA